MTGAEFAATAWEWKPSVAIGCLGLIGAYSWALGCRFDRRFAVWLAGVGVLLVALVSPLDALADTWLFSAHMAQHILLVLVVPALLLIGLPARPVERLLRKIGRASAQRQSMPAAVAWVAGVGAMLLWHVPGLFNAACHHRSLHVLEHVSLLAGGSMFWWPVLAPVRRLRMQPVPQCAAYLFSACLACTAMGILITFSPRILYSAYVNPPDSRGMLTLIRDQWGISAAMDQQMGGLLMWVPCCLVYLTAILAMFARWYAADAAGPVREGEREMEKRWV